MDKVKVKFTNALAYYELANTVKNYLNENTIIICIGTDRCIGDCLGPLVGTLLKNKFFPLPVYGTISEPIHALNLEKKLVDIKNNHPKAKIIGIDACLGDSNSIGEIQFRDYPIHPGKGVGKSLPDVGDTSLIGIVDSSENNELFTNRTIRLNLIIEMAKVISHSFLHAYFLYSKENKKD
ncbi:spore protease YyaC [Clostridium sp. 19966]|uniref:spore protease YyaC n=1 Tax=Clostridium sp. 19966 TaxID=2768166 RepID=UPI0028DE4C29|nr:spore protease YyaC [Clostridium sp. 19966]MDT8715576.1 spore protease YyaC [Clostridium sp. 19966]